MVAQRGKGNSVSVQEQIARESLMRLKFELVLPRLATFWPEQYFENRIGNTLTIKKPYKARVSRGRHLWDPAGTGNLHSDRSAGWNPLIDENVTISVDNTYNFWMEWSAWEATLDINQLYDRYFKAGIEQLGYRYDALGGEELAFAIHATEGTTGTGLTQDQIPLIRAHAAEIGLPRGMDSFGVFNEYDSAVLQADLGGAAGQGGKYNEGIVREAIERDRIGMYSGFDCFNSIHVPSQRVRKVSGLTAPAVHGALHDNGSTVRTDGWGVNSEKVLYKGQLIQIAGVGEVFDRSYEGFVENSGIGPNSDPSKRPTGRSKTFTVTADVTTNSTGEADIPISPRINDGGLNIQDEDNGNVSLAAFANVTAGPADNAQVTIVGLPSGSSDVAYRQNVFFHRSALAYVPVQLAEPDANVRHWKATDEATNLSVDIVSDYNINERKEIVRADVLFGVKNIYPELGVRHWGSQEGSF